ncbi:hypothetical protein J6590_089374, partial [Homalodisca vitripennis]
NGNIIPERSYEVLRCHVPCIGTPTVNSKRYLKMVLTNVTVREVFISHAQLLLYSSPLTTSTKMLLNTLIIRPYITYPNPVWYDQLLPEYILNHSNTRLFFPIWNSVGCSEQCYDALFGIPTLGNYIKAQT